MGRQDGYAVKRLCKWKKTRQLWCESVKVTSGGKKRERLVHDGKSKNGNGKDNERRKGKKGVGLLIGRRPCP